ncbi:MAG: heimdallarchaeosortase [Candidatus Hodarchaeales archaeon]|jgi:exosortase/archaeosortase family protein
MTSETQISTTTSHSMTMKTTDKAQSPTEEAPKRFHDDKLMLISLGIAVLAAFLLYSLPDWVFLEIPARDIISGILNILGIQNTLIPNIDPSTVIPEALRGGPFPFLEATVDTPGIHIPSTNGDYWIVKACTGMQAGGLLLAIIMVTEAPWISKVRASLVFFIALFIGNTLRITFHLWCVSFLVTQFHMNSLEAFYWAHDVSSKVIGFFGTILFAFIIEKMGVPIIDQFADWLDYLWWRTSKLYSRLF